jgi:hypothetical protein
VTTTATPTASTAPPIQSTVESVLSLTADDPVPDPAGGSPVAFRWNLPLQSGGVALPTLFA